MTQAILSQEENLKVKFPIREPQNTLIRIEIDASDIKFTRNVADGKLTETFVQDFEATSDDGKLFVKA